MGTAVILISASPVRRGVAAIRVRPLRTGGNGPRSRPARPAGRGAGPGGRGGAARVTTTPAAPAGGRGRRPGGGGGRGEYAHQPGAPAATCVAPSAFAAVRDIAGRILLVRPCARGEWVLPGGQVGPGGSASDAAIRETAEESGMTVEITGLAGLYTDPGHVI